MSSNARRFTVRFITFLASLVTIFGIGVSVTGTAFAETPDTNPSANFYMSWGPQFDPTTQKMYTGSASNVYEPTDSNPYNWYSCYIPDCDGLVADTSGVHLLSQEKSQSRLATDHHILGGNYEYSYTALNGDTFFYGGSWNGMNTLPWHKQFYSGDTKQWITLTLSYASLELYWTGQPSIPACDTATVEAVGFCSMK